MPVPWAHSWMTSPKENGRSVSVCVKCDLAVDHKSGIGPSHTAADRHLNGKRLKCREPLPLCSNGKREKAPPRHVWKAMGDAPPSPSGSPCKSLVCERCNMQVETLKSVRCIASRSNNRFWRRYRMSDAEEWRNELLPVCFDMKADDLAQYVRDNWDKVSVPKMAKALGVSMDAIRHRAKLMGLKSELTAGGHKPWSEKDDLKLQWEFETRSVKAIAKELGREYDSVRRRAYHLGLLQNGYAQGYESLEAASKRTGYNPDQLKRMLQGRNVRAKRVDASQEKLINKVNRKVYRTDDIDDAVKDWLKTETFYQACLRLEILPHRMKKMLSMLGVERPEKLAGQHWRISSDILDKAAKLSDKVITPSEYAQRKGIGVVSVTRRLVKMGVEKARTRKVVYLHEDFYDEMMKKYPIEPKYNWRDKGQ